MKITKRNNNRIKSLLLIKVSILLHALCLAQVQPRIKHIVVIGIDGLSSNGFKSAYTPCMDSLRNTGAYSYTVRSVLPTSSKPNWNAMICGAGPEATGTIDESWTSGVTNFPYTSLDDYKRFPNIFNVIRKQNTRAEIGAIYDWSGFGDLLNKEQLNYWAACETQREVAQKAVTYILEKSPNFLFIHFDNPDHLGHSIGFMSPDYTKAVEETDMDVKLVIDAINKSSMAANTMVMVVADHGGIANTHGGTSYEEFNTPIIFSGKGIKKNYLIKQQIYKYDVAANICFALGLKAPQVWTGRANKSAFAGFGEPDNVWQGGAVLPPPYFSTKKIIIPYGGLFVDTPAIVNIQLPVDVKGEIRYTLDGSNPDSKSLLYTTSFTLNKSAIVTAAVFNGSDRSTFVKAEYRVAKNDGNHGLNYFIYHLDSNVNSLPDFGILKPVYAGTCFELGVKSPENEIAEMAVSHSLNKFKTGVGVRFSGWIQIDEDGVYNFSLWSTGASKLFIGSELVVNNNNNGSQHRGNGGMVYLKKGFFPIKLDLFYDGKSERVLLYAGYGSNNMVQKIIPPEKLFKKKQNDE
ncbi:MAG: alkaline phosphatase family protein [Chitinophagaceae bacterium]|nr:alkaline phosphatase family protein [Chitinophagaceae bacterium]